MTWNRNVRKFLSEVKNKFWSLLFMLGDISSKQTFKYTIVILYPKKQKKIGQNYSTGLKIFFKSLRKKLDQGKKASSSSFLATIAQWFCVFLMVWVFLTAPYHSSMWNSHNKLASSQWNHTHMKASHTPTASFVIITDGTCATVWGTGVHIYWTAAKTVEEVHFMHISTNQKCQIM